MAFDIESAKKSGYSNTEIADYLAGQSSFDVNAARKAGYSDDELINHLSDAAPKQEQKGPPGIRERLSTLDQPGDPNNPTIPGIVRGFRDLRERGTQIMTQAAPGDVYGETPLPMMAGASKAEQAAMLYQRALNRELTPEELSRIKAEPDAAFEMAKMQANKSAAADRRQFDEQANFGNQLTRGGTNIAPALALRMPPSVAALRGWPGVMGRAAANTGMGAGIGASEFVQPGQTRGENAAYGGILQGVLGTGLEGAANMMPARSLARELELGTSLETPAAKKGIRGQDFSGIDKPLSQLTGDVGIGAVESQVARYNEASKIAHADHVRVARETGKLLNKKLNEVSEIPYDAATAGEKLAGAFDSHWNAVDKQASDIFKGALQQARTLTGDKPVIDTNNIRNLLDTKIKELKNLDVKTDDKLAELASLESMKKKFMEYTYVPKGEKGKKINISTIQSLLSEAGSDAAGSGRMVADLKTEKDRFVAGLIKRALVDDLSSAAEQSGSTGEAARLLKEARTQYSDLKKYQDEIGNTTFGKLFNGKASAAPETVYRVFSKQPTSQKSQFLSSLSKADPEVLPALQRAYFDDVIKRSGSSEGGAAGSYPVDMKKLADNWKVDNDFLLLFKGDARNDLIQIRKELRRVADQPQSFGGGQSSVSSKQAAAGVAMGIAQGSPQSAIFGVRALTQKVLPKVYGKLLFTPEGRQALLATLKPTSYSPSEVTAGIAYIRKIANEAEPTQ